MALARIARLDTGSIAAGGFVDLEYSVETDLTLKRIEAVEAGGAALSNIIATLFVAGEPLFRPDASLALFVPTRPEPIIIDKRVAAGTKITMRVTNNTTATVRVYIHLIFE